MRNLSRLHNLAAAIGIAVLLLTMVVPSFALAASTNSTDAPVTMYPDHTAPSAATSSPVCTPGGICPAQLLKAYDVAALQAGGINGTGQTVVIVDACGSPTIASDLHTFDSQFGLSNPILNVVDVQGTPCSNVDWGVETSLDVEWSHVMAPGATIDLLISAKPSSADLYGAWSYALTNNLGNQISNSWGGTSKCGSTATGLLKTATADGVTILASSGDFGAWGQGMTLGAQSPADCKGVLTIGGTTLHIMTDGTYISEAAWSGAGGGYVPNKSEPNYQKVAAISDSFGLLAKSDVSAVANPSTGVWFYDSGIAGGWAVVGGTSVACPLWAGFMADVNQMRTTNGFVSAGMIQPFLYKVVYGASGGSSLYATDFHDVTTGSDGWPAGPGWDAPTGLGTFDANNLAQTLGSHAGPLNLGDSGV